MIRRIIEINEERCNGCGICADACHEGAIAIIEGKAKLMRDDYCDGLGDCLPACPTNAISFIEREALPYDEEAVKANMANKKSTFSCPGSASKSIKREAVLTTEIKISSQLNQWPVQIKLAPLKAPYFNNSDLLIAADCTAFAYGNFHTDFMKNKITLIGCPKLDSTDYSEKLTEIIKNNEVKSVTVARMEVPCCGGIENAVKKALIDSGKFIPWNVVTISTDGKIL